MRYTNHACHDDHIYNARREALHKALSRRGLPQELCAEIGDYLPHSPLCHKVAYDLLTPDTLDALRSLVIVDGQEPLTLWITDQGEHQMTVARQTLSTDFAHQLVHVETREYSVRVARREDVRGWYGLDPGFVTILGEVEEPDSRDVYTLMYHPYCFWEDARTDVCGIMHQSPELLQFLEQEGVPLRPDIDWPNSLHDLIPQSYFLLAPT